MQMRLCLAFVALTFVSWAGSLDADDFRFITEYDSVAAIGGSESQFAQAPVVQVSAETMSTSGSVGSDWCGDCCQACPPQGWFVSLGLNAFRPVWQTNQALAILAPLGGGQFATTAREFDFDYEVSPFIDLGCVAQNGLGFRVGYWDFSGNSRVSVTPPVGGFVSSAAPLGLGAFATTSPIQADAQLAFHLWDFELTQQLVHDQWWWQFAGGLRYLHISQGYNVTTSGAAIALDDLISSHEFDGAGPTLAVKGQRQLGDSNFSLFGLARGSLVFGDNSQQSQLFSASGTLGGPASQASQSVVGMTELEIGVWYQWSFNRFKLVATGGAVGQYWSNVGNAANTDTFTAGATDEAQNNTAGMGLFGARTTLQLWF